MYQVFNVEKNRWQKFDKNGKLLGTKRTEGPYVKIPLKSEDSEETLQEIKETKETIQKVEGSKEIPQKTEESEETLQKVEESEEIPQKTEGSKETLQEIEGAEETLEETEEITQTKTVHEWLNAEKMELLSDNGILKSIGLTEQSKISFTKYAEIVPKLSVRMLW